MGNCPESSNLSFTAIHESSTIPKGVPNHRAPPITVLTLAGALSVVDAWGLVLLLRVRIIGLLRTPGKV